MNPIVQTLSNLDVNSRGGCTDYLIYQNKLNKDHVSVLLEGNSLTFFRVLSVRAKIVASNPDVTYFTYTYLHKIRNEM